MNVKRASIRLRERDLFKGQMKSTDMVSFSQMERLMKALEEVRDLKVSIVCYVTEIDHHGDHYLGDLDLRKVVASSERAVVRQQQSAAPPIPPRQPVKQGAGSEKPQFCILEMRVPTSVACSNNGSPYPGRKVSNGSGNHALNPPSDPTAGFQRSTSQGYASMLTPEGEFLIPVNLESYLCSNLIRQRNGSPTGKR